MLEHIEPRSTRTTTESPKLPSTKTFTLAEGTMFSEDGEAIVLTPIPESGRVEISRQTASGNVYSTVSEPLQVSVDDTTTGIGHMRTHLNLSSSNSGADERTRRIREEYIERARAKKILAGGAPPPESLADLFWPSEEEKALVHEVFLEERMISE